MDWTQRICSMATSITRSHALDYFLWEYVKNIVYSEPPTRDDIIARITTKLENISPEKLRRTVEYIEFICVVESKIKALNIYCKERKIQGTHLNFTLLLWELPSPHLPLTN